MIRIKEALVCGSSFQTGSLVLSGINITIQSVNFIGTIFIIVITLFVNMPADQTEMAMAIEVQSMNAGAPPPAAPAIPVEQSISLPDKGTYAILVLNLLVSLADLVLNFIFIYGLQKERLKMQMWLILKLMLTSLTLTVGCMVNVNVIKQNIRGFGKFGTLHTVAVTAYVLLSFHLVIVAYLYKKENQTRINRRSEPANSVENASSSSSNDSNSEAILPEQ